MKKLFFILLIGMFMLSFSSATLTDGLPSYYQMNDDLATTNVIDIINNNDGTLEGGDNTQDISVTGIIGKALHLDGSSDIIDLNDGNDFDFTTSDDFSISFWIKPDEWVNGQRIFSNDDGSNGYQIIEATAGGSGTGNNIQFWGNGGSLVVSTDEIVIGEWNHIVVTFEGGTAKIYINDSTPFSGSTTISASSNDLYIGWDPSLSDNYYDGVIDEIGIWNRTLSSSEVSELYNSGGGLTYPFIVSQLSVTLNSPTDGVTISGDITFNATLTPGDDFNLTNGTLFIWDSDGNIFTTDTNIILGDESNTTSFVITNLTFGNYEWNVLGSSENATGFLSSNFSEFNNTFLWVPFSIDDEEFNTNVFETSRQEFFINISTLPSVLSVDAILNYNGTRFTSDTICSTGLCQISTAIDIPLVTTGENENKSFFWEISIFDGTNSFSTNLTENNQNVTRLNLEKCDGTYTVETLNFTSFDEQTQELVDPFIFDGSFEFWLGTGRVKRNNSISELSISSLQLCLTPVAETLFLDGTIEYDEASGTNYTNRNYFFQNDQINNISQDIRLGLLLAEDSTSFILKVQDRDILPVANVLIFTERFYPGEGVFKVVQVSETDDNGRTLGFFQTETVEYRFILKQNGSTVLTTNKQKIVGESVPFTLTFTIGEDEGAAWEPFEEVDDLTSSIDFDKTSNIVSFSYADTSEDFSLGRLVVEKVNASGLQNTIICSETSIESSAIITCNLTGNSTGRYIMRGIITRDSDPFLEQQKSFAIEDFSTISGRLGLFLGWFIILISVFAFKFNEVAGIILVNLAMIMVNLIGLISFGYGFISAMIAISIIILVVLER